jgi:hypothetical protein
MFSRLTSRTYNDNIAVNQLFSIPLSLLKRAKFTMVVSKCLKFMFTASMSQEN